MRLVFRPEAKNEIFAAQNWYEERAVGLGLEFARAVEVAVERLLRAPKAYASLDAQYRHLLLRRFPYSIVYHVNGAEIVVVSCFHHRRRPVSWMRNVSD